MAEAAQSIFTKKATEKLRNPDDLDKYVQVTNPRIWVVLLACVAVLAGLLAWGVFGAVETSISTTGTVLNSGIDEDEEATLVCFLPKEEAERVSPGNEATVNGEQVTVKDVGTIPVSAGEAYEILESDYLAKTLVNNDWSYIVTFDGDVSDYALCVPMDVSITINRVPPISLILRNDE